MRLNHYRFRAEWTLRTTVSEAYAALENVDDYPQWWREVRSIRHVSHDAYEITARSVLPYDLTFIVQQARRDPIERVLEGSMLGDLDGFSRWSIVERGRYVLIVFEEEVEVKKALLRALAFIARPAFRANHAWMMRSGEMGLRKFLENGQAVGRR